MSVISLTGNLMRSGFGIVRQHGGSLILTIPSDLKTALELKPDDEVRFYMEKITQEIKDEEYAKHNYPDIATGELYLNLRGKETLLATFDRVYYAPIKFQFGALGDGQSIDSLPVTRTWAGIAFRGEFRTSGFTELAQDKVEPEWAIRMLDGLGKLILTPRHGKKIEVKCPVIEFTEKPDPFKNRKIYNVHFHGD